MAVGNAGGGLVGGSYAAYEPFGTFLVQPTGTNPSVTDRGFTGQRSNNLSPAWLGLVYMNARYYHPQLGRFVSPDSIVPEPENPQSFNRYSYVRNSPMNFTDPTGHCISNYEAGSADMHTCVAGWNAVVNYLSSVTYGAGGNGQFPNEKTTEWLMNADIATLEGLMRAYGIDYGYTWTPPQRYQALNQSGRRNLKSPEARAEVCDYWQSCYQPATDHYIFTAKLLGPVAIRVIWDDFGNLYIGGLASTMPGVSLLRGDANIASGDAMLDIGELPVNMREAVLQESLVGPGAGFSGGGRDWEVVGAVIQTEIDSMRQV